VFRPRGLLWFYSASTLCPRQSEMRVFRLSVGIQTRSSAVMRWMLRHCAASIGHPASPPMYWWIPHSAHRRLQATSFEAIWDRGSYGGWRRRPASAVNW